jgi:hypothetical protein
LYWLQFVSGTNGIVSLSFFERLKQNGSIVSGVIWDKNPHEQKIRMNKKSAKLFFTLTAASTQAIQLIIQLTQNGREYSA